MDSFKDILIQLGYSLIEYPKEFRAKPIYRESGNNTSLRVNKSTGSWRDYGWGVGGSFPELVKLTLGLESVDKAKEYLQNKFQFTHTIKREKPQLKGPKYLDKRLLTHLLPVHDYWLNRGISLETLQLFKGGLVLEKGGMQNRYVFPIWDSKNNLIGATGRDITGKSQIKWKHKGVKSEWKYPFFLNHKIIQEKKEIILVESVGCCLSLWDAGIKNIICLFGIEISIPVLNCLLKIDPSRIIVSLNNDGAANNNIGNDACVKVKNKLNKFFDARQIKVHLPTAKDFNEMTLKQILDWYASTK